jgi:hypothetical protein
MADADKIITIKPQTGTTAEPTIECVGKDNVKMTIRVLDDGTLSFESVNGQVFSISPDIASTIFRVSDISGVPLIDVNGVDRTVDLIPYGGVVRLQQENLIHHIDRKVGRHGGKPAGMIRMVCGFKKTSNLSITIKHDGNPTGFYWSKEGGTPTWVAQGTANATTILTIPHSGGAPFEVYIWPATSSTSGVVSGINYISLYNAGVLSLDVRGLTELYYLGCHNNLLTSLDVSGLTALTSLYCYSNLLTSLDVSGLTALSNLNCSYNLLTSLDVSGLTALSYLSCASNLLTSLDVSDLTALSTFLCSFNQLTSLFLSSGPYSRVNANDNPNLTDLTVGDNFDAQGGYAAGPYGIHYQDGITLHNTGLSGATLDAFYQKLTSTPSSGYYGAGFIYLKNVEDPSTDPCVGWDSDNPALAPVAWTIYGT